MQQSILFDYWKAYNIPSHGPIMDAVVKYI